MVPSILSACIPAKLNDLATSSACATVAQNAMAVFMGEVLEKNKIVERPDLLVSFDEVNSMMGYENLEELEKKFAA